MEPALKSPVFGPLAGLREAPIPDQGPARARHEGFRRHPIDRLGPHGNEPLVDLKSCAIAGENYYHATRNPPYWGGSKVRCQASCCAPALRKSCRR